MTTFKLKNVKVVYRPFVLVPDYRVYKNGKWENPAPGQELNGNYTITVSLDKETQGNLISTLDECIHQLLDAYSGSSLGKNRWVDGDVLKGKTEEQREKELQYNKGQMFLTANTKEKLSTRRKFKLPVYDWKGNLVETDIEDFLISGDLVDIVINVEHSQPNNIVIRLKEVYQVEEPKVRHETPKKEVDYIELV